MLALVRHEIWMVLHGQAKMLVEIIIPQQRNQRSVLSPQDTTIRDGHFSNLDIMSAGREKRRKVHFSTQPKKKQPKIAFLALDSYVC
jgi:hypothetical protein